MNLVNHGAYLFTQMAFIKSVHAEQLASRFLLSDIGSLFSYYFIYCIIKSIVYLEAKKMFYIVI